MGLPSFTFFFVKSISLFFFLIFLLFKIYDKQISHFFFVKTISWNYFILGSGCFMEYLNEGIFFISPQIFAIFDDFSNWIIPKVHASELWKIMNYSKNLGRKGKWRNSLFNQFVGFNFGTRKILFLGLPDILCIIKVVLICELAPTYISNLFPANIWILKFFFLMIFAHQNVFR